LIINIIGKIVSNIIKNELFKLEKKAYKIRLKIKIIYNILDLLGIRIMKVEIINE
jgi:hypothetical protein